MSFGDLAHLGHVELLTPEPERSLRFFVEALGMEQEAADGQSVFLRGWGDYQRYCLKLTEAAARRISELTSRADSEIVGLRVGIKNGGCAGQSYTVEYAHEVRPSDEVVEDKGVKILVDPKAVLFLLGTEMDYKVDKMSAQFIFNNPNQTGACGCGESVQLTAAKVDG